MVALVTRYEELLAPTANGSSDAASDDSAADAGAEASPEAAARSARALALTNAAHQITHHSMSLQKTRQHFQKVRARARWNARQNLAPGSRAYQLARSCTTAVAFSRCSVDVQTANS